MSDIVERIKNRKKVSPVVVFELDGIKWEVSRFAQAEQSRVLFATREHFEREGINPDGLSQRSWIAQFIVERFKLVRKHIKSWQPVGWVLGADEEVSVDEVVDLMSFEEQGKFIKAFDQALAEDEEKALGKHQRTALESP
jgi:hypothetical protein